MPVQHHDVCQSSAMDNGIVYRHNPIQNNSTHVFIQQIQSYKCETS